MAEVGTMKSDDWRDAEPPPQTNYFNMRIVLLQNLCHYYATERAPSRSLAHSLQKNKTYLVSRSEDALDSVRAMFQKSLNKEIDAVIQRFSEKYLAPAISNIEKNGNEVAIADVHSVYQKILEEAKRMYSVTEPVSNENEKTTTVTSSAIIDRVGTPSMIGQVVGPIAHSTPPTKIVNRHIPAGLRKRKEAADSDTESDISQASVGFRKKPKQESGYTTPKRTPTTPSSGAGSTTRPVDIPEEDAEKWNPNRVDENTVFVLGSKANSALGLSAQRGRIYIKHPGLFRYIGDHDDKMWLFENRQKTVKFGGKAFLIVMDDVVQLAETAEYRNNPDVNIADLNGFTLPPFIIDKIKSKMEPVYDGLRVRYGLAATPLNTTSEQPSADDGRLHMDILNPDIQASPMAASDGGSDT